MKRVTYRSLADIAHQKAAIRTAIEQQKATTMSHYLLPPLLEGVWFGIKIHRFAQSISEQINQLRTPHLPKRHL